MMEFVRVREVKTELSPHLLERSKGWLLSVMHGGITYYIPVSTEMKKVFGIHIENGKPVFDSYKQEFRLDYVLGDIVGSVYLQIRDTVGSEIATDLHQQLEDSFSKMFENVISDKVEKEFNKKLPPPDGYNIK
jgi:hypothetical protein